MRGTLIGVTAGLLLGTVGALAYSHYLGEGLQLAQSRLDLEAAQAHLTKTAQDSLQAQSRYDAMSTQIQQLNTRKDELSHQLDDLQKAAPANPAPANPEVAPNSMAVVMEAGMVRRQEEQLLLFRSRLHLTPEQEAALKIAMDAESKRGEEMGARMMAGGKIDPQTVAEFKNVKSTDQTLNEILTSYQKTAYDQLKTDQKNSAMETMASIEMNQMTPLLQLSDAQKDQVYNALYQVQIDEQNPAWIKNAVSPSDPTAILDRQNQAKEDALAKILTPDQMTAYYQQRHDQLTAQKAMMQRFMPSTSGQAAAAPSTTSAP